MVTDSRQGLASRGKQAHSPDLFSRLLASTAHLARASTQPLTLLAKAPDGPTFVTTDWTLQACLRITAKGGLQLFHTVTYP